MITAEDVKSLRAETGMGLMMCKEALDYAKGNIHLAKAYIDAKTLAVATPGMSFDKRVKSFMKE